MNRRTFHIIFKYTGLIKRKKNKPQLRTVTAICLMGCLCSFAGTSVSYAKPLQQANIASLKNAVKGNWYTLYVSPKGDDANSGTAVSPLRTVAFAIRKARNARRLKLNRLPDGQLQGIQILLEDGVYQPETTLRIRPEDGGSDNAPTRIAAVHKGKAVISGGRSVTGWQKINPHDPMYAAFPKGAAPNIYVAEVPGQLGTAIDFRQLWVNGHKAIRAESINGGSYGRPMQRIFSWDHKQQSCWIPKPAGFNPAQAVGMEMLIHQWWAIANLRIRLTKVMGDSVQLYFMQPESKIESEHPWPAPWLSTKTGNSAFYLSNAPCFLDAPGEWYFDRGRQRLYYLPRKGEDLSLAKVIFPFLTAVLNVEGTPEATVNNIQLSGIDFRYCTWLRPSNKGHVALQAGMFLKEAYKLQRPGTPEKRSLENQAWIGRPPGGVQLYYTQNAIIEDCSFRHMASTGLDLVIGTKGSVVLGNLFKDIGGTGVQVGTYSPENQETHLPYNPVNPADICQFDTIENNLVTDAANEDWGCVGISAGYVHNLYIAHNEVSDVSYSGICVGWGWTRKISALSENQILDNKVTHYGKRMYDVGGLYTLSAQPGTVIEGNYIDSIYKAPYPHDPDHWFYFYLDEGSSYITIKNNWCPALKVMKNANGPGNSLENNGPQVADSIKQNAGLTANYQYLLNEKIADGNWPVQPVPVISIKDKN